MRSRKNMSRTGSGLKSGLSQLSTKRESKRTEKKEKQIMFNQEAMNLAKEIVMNDFTTYIFAKNKEIHHSSGFNLYTWTEVVKIVRLRLNKKNKNPLEKAAYKIIRSDDTFLKELNKDKLYYMPLPKNDGYRIVHTIQITSNDLTWIKPLADGTFYYDNPNNTPLNKR